MLENIETIFTGVYLQYEEVPKKAIVEWSITETVKLRRRRIAEIEEEEKNINNESFKQYFADYRSPKWHEQKITRDRR